MADQIFPLRVATDIGVIVRKLDPERTKDEREQVEYEFSNGREFRRNYRDAYPYNTPIWLDDDGNPILDDDGRTIPTGPAYYVSPTRRSDFNGDFSNDFGGS